MSKHLARVCVPALAVLALAGCGSSNNSSTSTTGTTASSGSGAVSSIAAQVPAPIKSRGYMIVASDATYAPNEFISPNGHTVIGMDADLVHALAEVMGIRANIVNATFDTIIPGLAAGKYDMGASSFTDTKEREKTVDFVTYFQAGVSFYAKAGSNTGIKTLADICGKTVSVEKGTTEQEEATEQGKKCSKEGKKPVTVLSYPTQNEANLAIASGRAQVGMADSPVAEYQVKQSNGTFELVGETYGTAPYGLAFPKGSALTKPVLAALKELMANGTYMQILKKWGVEAGAITEPKINGATS